MTGLCLACFVYVLPPPSLFACLRVLEHPQPPSLQRGVFEYACVDHLGPAFPPRHPNPHLPLVRAVAQLEAVLLQVLVPSLLVVEQQTGVGGAGVA